MAARHNIFGMSGSRLGAAEPLAAALARDSGLAQRTDSYPYDHEVADVLLAIDRLLRVLHERDRDLPSARR